MKVLFICSGNRYFSISPFIKVQADSLLKSGVSVDFFMIEGKGIIGYIKNIFSLRKNILNNKYNILHAHYSLSGLVTLLTFIRLPLVVSFMGSDLYGITKKNKLGLIQSKVIILLTYIVEKLITAGIVKSKYLMNLVKNQDKFIVLPNGVNIDLFKPIPFSEATTKLNLNGGKKYILFLGDIKDPRKNYELLKNSLLYLNDSNYELICPYPVEHNIIPLYLNIAHVVVSTSFLEGSPNIIKEAMACNCPIISTDVGDVKENIEDIKNCYIISFDPKELARKLSFLIKEKVKTNGREKLIAKGLDSDSIARKLYNLYDNLL